MLYSFKDFIKGLVVEELHPELHAIVRAKTDYRAKQLHLSRKIKDLTSRGERLGIESNMPKGSSRAYLKHTDDKEVEVDGNKVSLPVGTKVAIKAGLDPHHDKDGHGGLSLGALQNEAEGGDFYVNHHYRILSQDTNNSNRFTSNKDKGIFPPLFDHDHENHEWSHVGHVEDINAKQFKELTKTESHPNGLSHKDFHEALIRHHDMNHGKYWKGTAKREKQLDHVESHPLVEKFLDFHSNFGHPPHDYRQIKNLGVWKHPDGTSHIVSRDHGFSNTVAEAYRNARMKSYIG